MSQKTFLQYHELGSCRQFWVSAYFCEHDMDRTDLSRTLTMHGCRLAHCPILLLRLPVSFC